MWSDLSPVLSVSGCLLPSCALSHVGIARLTALEKQTGSYTSVAGAWHQHPHEQGDIPRRSRREVTAVLSRPRNRRLAERFGWAVAPPARGERDDQMETSIS
ncbi:hypothetical protein GCM10014719_59770 [Planomonospora parontospora subsp. antibiotica]|nr:hypothetical protein GCM10014719_59770 [Planomonospora parontospora subsp. antibiotica]GII18995.1 hypothetical protein Ppa05_57210 [Planomonospora parontospora subsp. antibiotica]